MGLGLGFGLGICAASAPFTPASIPGLQLWVRGDKGITLNGSNVSAWGDLSGNGVNLVQASAPAQPAYHATDAALNNQSSVATGATVNVTGTLTLAQPCTILVVGYLTANATQVFGGQTSRCDFGRDANGFYMFGGIELSNNTAAPDSNPHALGGLFNGASSKLWVDVSASPFSGNAGTNSLIGPSVADFGGTGACAEVVAYTGSLTNVQVGLLFAYFGARYGKSWS